MDQELGLRVVLCPSKELDYGRGYETFAARRYAKRQEAVETLRTSHPFPLAPGAVPEPAVHPDNVRNAFQAAGHAPSANSGIVVQRKGTRRRIIDRPAGERQLRAEAEEEPGAVLVLEDGKQTPGERRSWCRQVVFVVENHGLELLAGGAAATEPLRRLLQVVDLLESPESVQREPFIPQESPQWRTRGER